MWETSRMATKTELQPPVNLSVNLKEILSWEPCYPMAQIHELATQFGRKQITALEALNLPIPAKDRLWLVLRPKMIPKPIIHEFACCCAEAALNLVESQGGTIDARSREAIRVKRAWLKGETTDDDLAAARTAAWAVVKWTIAKTATEDAAAKVAALAIDWATIEDAWDIAWTVARDAAWIATWHTIGDREWTAARNAVRESQVKILRSLLAPQS